MITAIWGDSITFGAGDQEGLGWPGRIRRTFASGDLQHVYNFGICGETSSDLIKRFDIERAATDPDRILFAIGINDSKYPNAGDATAVPIEFFAQNMCTLINQAKQSTDDVILVGPTCVGGEFSSSNGSIFSDKSIVRYRDALMNIADEQALTWIDLLDILDPKTDLCDGVHPNTQGYQKIFERISAKITWV